MPNEKSTESRPCRIACVQFSPGTGDVDGNLATVEEALGRLDANVNLVVLPEVWTAGYGAKNLMEIADQTPRIIERLGEHCRRLDTVIVGSLPETDGRQVYNTAYVLDSDRHIVGKYRKVHLIPLMREDEIYGRGHTRLVENTSAGRIGAAICFDLRFPDLIRPMALARMEMLVLPCQWPHPRLPHYRTLALARAIENQCFVVTCNRTGSAKGLDFFGNSMVIDPWGEVVGELKEEETILEVEIDLAQIEEVREKLPSLSIRVPEAYH